MHEVDKLTTNVQHVNGDDLSLLFGCVCISLLSVIVSEVMPVLRMSHVVSHAQQCSGRNKTGDPIPFPSSALETPTS